MEGTYIYARIAAERAPGAARFRIGGLEYGIFTHAL
jgi:hypothetical protein